VFRPHEDHIFGKLKARSRWVNTADLEDPFQKEDWLDGEEEKGGPNGELHIQNHADAEAEAGWTANQVWGFALIDGVRYYTRRVVVKKGDEVLKVRLVYNYKGE
jgi:hypothetical protein